MKQTVLWFSGYDDHYNGGEPFFYDTSKIEVALQLEHNYEQFREELKALWGADEVAELKIYNDDAMQIPPRTFSKLVFKAWSIKNKVVCEKFPVTTALIDRFSAITSCFVTKLCAHSSIKPHRGDTNAILRIHLGLNIPECDKRLCGMQVGDCSTNWQNGKAFVFLDAHLHHVWNHSDHDRYVIVVDVLRPEFIYRKNFICTQIIVNQLFYNIASKIDKKVLYWFPSWVLHLIAYVFYLPIITVIKLNNHLGFIKL